jgi:hypothetical protein
MSLISNLAFLGSFALSNPVVLLEGNYSWCAVFAVAVNESLHNFVDSYLQFRRRWYNSRSWANSGAPTAGVVVGDGDLSRRVFMLLYRM